MNLLKSILTYRCPRCRIGSLFTEPLDFKKPLDMPKVCFHCGQKTEPELGFYFGAMFISYGLTSVMFLSIAAICVLKYGMDAEKAIGVVILFAILSFIKVLRLSRAIWIHIIIRYDSIYK